MKTILFICQANVGRSQMAEGFYNAYAKHSRAISAGIIDKREKYHNHPAPAVILAMNQKGIDISTQEIKLVSKEMITKADRVVVLCKKEELEEEFIDNEDKFLFKEVIDPAEQSENIILQARNAVEEIVNELLKNGYDKE